MSSYLKNLFHELLGHRAEEDPDQLPLDLSGMELHHEEDKAMRSDDQQIIADILTDLYNQIAVLKEQVAALQKASTDGTPVFDASKVAGYTPPPPPVVETADTSDEALAAAAAAQAATS